MGQNEIATSMAEDSETNKRSRNEEDEEPPEGEEEENKTSKRKRKRKRKTKATDDATVEQSSKNANETKLASLDHTVYVEGIPFDCSEEDVKGFFELNQCSDILQMRLPRWQDTGRLRGYGHIVFDTTESRDMAIKDLSGKNLGKRYLTIQAPHIPKPETTMGASSSQDIRRENIREQPAGCTIVFVKNLPYQATEDDLLEAFQVCGKVVPGGVRIARNYQTRHSKGFAYIEYKNPEGAHGAVQKAAKAFGMTVMGRPCFVDYGEGAMKGSYKTQEGKLWTKEYPGKKNPQQRSGTRSV